MRCGKAWRLARARQRSRRHRAAPCRQILGGKRWLGGKPPPAAEGGGRRPAFTGLATQPYSATEVDGWQHKLSRVSQNRAAVHSWPVILNATLQIDRHRTIRMAVKKRADEMARRARGRAELGAPA